MPRIFDCLTAFIRHSGDRLFLLELLPLSNLHEDTRRLLNYQSVGGVPTDVGRKNAKQSGWK